MKARAWMRRWSFDGEIPKKEKNDNGRLAWPDKFKFKEVTLHQVFIDDVPLFAAGSCAELSSEQIAAIGDLLGRMDSGLWSRGGVSEKKLLNAIYQKILESA
jgi:hypothetical protein